MDDILKKHFGYVNERKIIFVGKCSNPRVSDKGRKLLVEVKTLLSDVLNKMLSRDVSDEFDFLVVDYEVDGQDSLYIAFNEKSIPSNAIIIAYNVYLNQMIFGKKKENLND